MSILNFLAITDADMTKIIKPITDVCSVVVPALLTVVGAVGAVFVIILGVKYARADDPQEHEKAKNALKNAIIGFVIIFILLIMLNVGLNIFKDFYTSSIDAA